MPDFYDSLSSEYHLIFPDWDKAIERQAEVLDRLITKYSTIPSRSIWDCTCGIGTQAIGLAGKGYEVIGTDISPQSIERARLEAEKRNLAISFSTADIRDLPALPSASFAVILACDNALPHLLESSDLLLAAQHIKSRLTKNGLFMGSMRDYDTLLQTRPRSTAPTVIPLEGEKVITFQVWEWASERVYELHHFILREQGENYTTTVRKTKYRAYQRKEVTEQLRLAGFREVLWLLPEESGYYQPMFIAR